MNQPYYRFEQFIVPNFPLYISNPTNKVILTHCHYHKAAELILVTQGIVQIMIGTNSLTCGEGDIIFVPSLTMHEVIGLTDDAHIRGIIYELSLLETTHIQADFQTFLQNRPKLVPVISSKHSSYESLREHYNNILTIYDTLPADTLSVSRTMQLQSYLLLLNADLIWAFDLEEASVSPSHTRLRPVLDYIEKHFTEKIRINELSSLLFTCDDQLIRLFKTVTGETPMEYIMNLRLEAAMKLLTATELSMSEIAEQTGFGTANYMTRTFRNKLHRTPRSYRKPQ